MKKLIKEICKREGKKSQVEIGNVREVLNVLSLILAEDALNGSGDLLREWEEYSDKTYLKLEKKQKAISNKIIKKLKK